MKNEFFKALGKEITMFASIELLKFGIGIFRSMSSSTILIDEQDLGYEKLNKALYNVDPVKYSRYRIPTIQETTDFQLSVGTDYMIKLKNKNFIHVTVSQNDKKRTKVIKLSFHGPDKYRIRGKISKYVASNKSKKYIDAIPVGCNSYYNTSRLISLSFDDIVLKDDARNKIVGGLIGWNNDKEWFSENKMLHKIGVLLYGKPGTGKSTIVKCISNMFNNAKIYTVNGKSIKQSAMEILYSRRSTPNNEILIVLLEDFDMFSIDRENKNDDDDFDDDNLNCLFQMLDGIYSTDNTIYIATTNYIEKLDSALIRTGRFDIQVELDYFTKDESIEYIRKLNVDTSIIDSLELKFPISPSDLRSVILSVRAQNYYLKEECNNE